MMADIFSVFDDNNGIFSGTLFLIWGLSSLVLFLGLSKFWVAKNRWETLKGLLEEIIFELVSRTKGSGLGGFSLIISSLFPMIILFNFMGLLPYVFSITSHLVFSFSFALPLWLSLLLSSVAWNYYSFVAHFLPSGAPSALNPFLVVVEFASVAVRPITLSVRLTANMGAGHIILTLVGGFLTVLLVKLSGMSAILLYLVSSFYFMFEMAICCIQGYIFSLLLMLYSDEHSCLYSVPARQIFIL